LGLRKSSLIAIVAFLLCSSAFGQDDMIEEWNGFADAMNKYVTDLNRGENNYGELKIALRKWRKLEKSRHWDEIK
jgi:hypothetical protein